MELLEPNLEIKQNTLRPKVPLELDYLNHIPTKYWYWIYCVTVQGIRWAEAVKSLHSIFITLQPHWRFARFWVRYLTWHHAHSRSQDSMSAGDGGGDEEGDDEHSSSPGVVTAVNLPYPHRHRPEELKKRQRCLKMQESWVC